MPRAPADGAQTPGDHRYSPCVRYAQRNRFSSGAVTRATPPPPPPPHSRVTRRRSDSAERWVQRALIAFIFIIRGLFFPLFFFFPPLIRTRFTDSVGRFSSVRFPIYRYGFSFRRASTFFSFFRFSRFGVAEAREKPIETVTENRTRWNRSRNRVENRFQYK